MLREVEFGIRRRTGRSGRKRDAMTSFVRTGSALVGRSYASCGSWRERPAERFEIEREDLMLGGNFSHPFGIATLPDDG
jgi:hypothetical protein